MASVFQTQQHSRILWLCLVIAIGLKFWLIGNIEIIDEKTDAPIYVRMILDLGTTFYGFPPGTALLGKLLYHLGIPYRLGIEVLYQLACFCVITQMLASPLKRWWAFLCFCWVLFDPFINNIFSHCYSDSPALIFVLFGMGFLLAAYRHQQWKTALYGGLFFGLAAITRSLYEIHAVIWIALVLAVVLLNLKHVKPGIAPFFKRYMAPLFICAAASSAVYFGTGYYFSQKYDFGFGISIFDNTTYRNFYAALKRVGEPTGRIFYPIDKERMQLIGSISPATNDMVQCIQHSRKYTTQGDPDLPITLLHWAIYQECSGKDPVTQELNLSQYARTLNAITGDINSACDQGIVVCRKATSLPDDRYRIMMDYVPFALGKEWKMLFDFRRTPFYLKKERVYEDVVFNEALSRRTLENYQPSPAQKTFVNVWRQHYRPLLTPMTIAIIGALSLLLLIWNKVSKPAGSSLAGQMSWLILIAYAVGIFLFYTAWDVAGMSIQKRYLLAPHFLLNIFLFKGISFVFEPAAFLLRSTIRKDRKALADSSSPA